MDESSSLLSSKQRAGERRFARRRQVQLAVREARSALQDTLGIAAPPSHTALRSLRAWVLSLLCAVSRYGRRPWRGRRLALPLERHVATFLILLLLGVVVLGQGFSAYTAPAAASTGAEGGVRLLGQRQPRPSVDQTFASSVLPMAVVRQNAPNDEVAVADAPDELESALRTEVITYTVQAGDTIYSIAGRFDISAYTVFWQNELQHPSDLAAGMVLQIPPISGVPHTVRAGESLESISAWYGVRAGNIVGYPANELRYPYELTAGQEIFVPGGIIQIPDYRVTDGERPAPTLVQMPGGEKMRWPTWGTLTTDFGWSGWHGDFHYGIDIANSWRTPIYAAAAGTVVESGWGGLGWWVAIDHGNGFRSEYGHLNERPLVSAGEEVAKGQQIGYMGRTFGAGGYASGVHLHFAVRHLGVYIDPLPLLEN